MELNIVPGSIWQIGNKEICVWDCVVKNKKIEVEYMTERGEIFIRDFDLKLWHTAAKLIGSVE